MATMESLKTLPHSATLRFEVTINAPFFATGVDELEEQIVAAHYDRQIPDLVRGPTTVCLQIAG